MRIIMMQASGVGERAARAVVAAVGRLRREPLAKLPGIAEAVEWAEAATLLNEQGSRWPERSNVRSASYSRTRTISSTSRQRSTRSSRRRRRERPEVRSLTLSPFPRSCAAPVSPLRPSRPWRGSPRSNFSGPIACDIRRAAHATLAPSPERLADFDGLFDAHFLGAQSIVTEAAPGQDEPVRAAEDASVGPEPFLATDANLARRRRRRSGCPPSASARG